MLTAGRLRIAGGGRRREKLLLFVVPEFIDPSGSRRGAVSGAVNDTLVGWIVTTGCKCDGGVGVLRGGGGSGGGGCAGMT